MADLGDIAPAARVTIESLRAYGIEAFRQVGLSEEGATTIVEVQLESNLRGQATHHMGDVPGYARRLKAGQMKTNPEFRWTRETGISALLDADNGPGQWVGVVAMRKAIEKAHTSGVGVIGTHHSNHYGAAGHYAWMAAASGLIGLSTTNGGLVIAPYGGTSARLGNDPLGVGIPTAGRLPIVLDIAMSVVAVGKIGLALMEGRPLPLGWALDKAGKPTTEPQAAMEGSGLPIAGHKGYGLAMVMETLAGVLTTAGFALDHNRETFRGGQQEHNIGHFMLALDPGLFMPIEEFRARVDRLIDDMKSSDRIEGTQEILVPGELEMRARQENLAAGSVPLLPSTLKRLVDYQLEVGLTTELEVV